MMAAEIEDTPAQEPVPKPGEQTELQIDEEQADPIDPEVEPAPPTDVAAALAKAKTEWAAEHKAALETAKAEAAEKARAEERARVDEEQRKAAMTESDRLKAEKAESDQAAADARAETEQAKAAMTEAESRLSFSRALANTSVSLARNGGGKIDPALERLAFEEATKLADGGDLADAIGQLREIKPWMFAAPPAAASNTGSATPPAKRVGETPKPKGKPVFEMDDAEYRKHRRRLGIVS
jgi:membrane protein involved in colicin uptake